MVESVNMGRDRGGLWERGLSYKQLFSSWSQCSGILAEDFCLRETEERDETGKKKKIAGRVYE